MVLRRSPSVLLLPLLSLVLSGCLLAPGSDGAPLQQDVVGTPPDAPVVPPEPDPDPVPGGLHVLEVIDPTAAPACPDADSRECAEAYMAFALDFAPDGPVLGDDWGECRARMKDWVVQLDLAQRGHPADLSPQDRALMTPFDGMMSEDDLADEILDAMNLRVLLEDLDEQELRVTVRDVHLEWGTNAAGENTEYEQIELVLCAPHVGCFDARLLRPLTDGPVPAIVAMTGHPLSDSVLNDFSDQLFGRRYAIEGFAFLIVASRAFDSSVVEDDAAVELLCAGSSLYALHNLEALLAAKYLRWLRERGEVSRIGFVGHSSGSVSGMALYRYADRVFPGEFQAFVADSSSSYMQVQPCEGYPKRVSRPLCIIDETLPELFSWHWAINNPEAAPHTVPFLVPEPCYAFECEGDMERVLDFFGDHLGLLPAGRP